MLFNRLTAVICLLNIYITVFAQKSNDYKFGNVTTTDFNFADTKIIDSVNADALILYSGGSTHFKGNRKAWFDYVYTCTKKIKIINKRAFDLATVIIPLYKTDEDAEILSDVRAVTYNLSNNIISSTVLDKNSIFSEVFNKTHILKKFTLPAVQEGSVIEYTYTITSPYTFNMPSWQFQSTEYPVLWSEYKVSIPSALTYVLIRNGFDSFYTDKSWIGKETYTVVNPADKGSLGSQDETLSVTSGTLNHQWVEKNLYPLKAENFTTTPENYIDKIEFQLSATDNGQDKSAVWNTWQAACKEIANENDFQQSSSHDNAWIKELPDFKNSMSNLNIAKSIYYYIQNNYTCTDTSNVFKHTNIYDTYKNQKGSVRDINLLLIAMLNNKNIYAEPVMLSTRDNGFLNPYYPVRDKFNYLICRTRIDGKTYLLDATETNLGFGELPVKCYNGYARVINERRPDSLYLMADSVKDSDVAMLTLNNENDGSVSGTYKIIMGAVESEQIRKAMQTQNSKMYFNNLKKEYLFDVNINNTAVDSIDQKEMPVTIRYDLTFKPDADIIYFNPLIGNSFIQENPFKSAQRTCPVEMPYCIDKIFILNMQTPDGYEVDEIPKSTRVSLNDQEGKFEYLIQNNDGNIQLLCKLNLNKASFSADDYETLRNFFASVVKKESEQIVFKKK